MNLTRLCTNDPVPVCELPPNLVELSRRLECRPDNTGLRSIDPAFDVPESVTPVEFRSNEPYQITDLLRTPAFNTVVMTPSQAALCILWYAQVVHAEAMRVYDSTGRMEICGRTLWVPFAEHEIGCTSPVRGVLRLYVRDDASIELFIYPANDPAVWAHGQDYAHAIAYHKFG